jgi:hypothetical protein
MEATGRIQCYRRWGTDEDYQSYLKWVQGSPPTVYCVWEGGAVAAMSNSIVGMAKRGESNMYMTGKHTLMIAEQLHVRILGMRLTSSGFSDVFYVMREGWYARLVHLDRRATFAMLCGLVWVEARIRRLFGQFREEERMSVASFLADRVL